jgi:2-keto-4-pentenoate hydratase/2-oxohepta-3-ene-1,7-dioic acid hydratase in catechol pathway
MRLVTYIRDGEQRLGALSGDDEVVDLQRASGSALPPGMLAFLRAGDDAMAAARDALANAEPDARVALDGERVRLGPPVPEPRTVLAIGLNYRDHAAETGAELPKRPIVFSKVATCITGPGMPVYLPKASRALDWEGELCVVIGKPARHVAAADAHRYVAGYMAGNDVSVRDWQSHSPTWMMGKGFDTHGPTGPWLVTPDEVGDPGALDVRTWVNDELKQNSNTRELIFDVPAIIEYLTTAFTLQPGDVIFTGTPAGVAIGHRPPRFLQAGDVVRVEITNLGVLENPVINEP